jgi:hypothetical protein
MGTCGSSKQQAAKRLALVQTARALFGSDSDFV